MVNDKKEGKFACAIIWLSTGNSLLMNAQSSILELKRSMLIYKISLDSLKINMMDARCYEMFPDFIINSNGKNRII